MNAARRTILLLVVAASTVLAWTLSGTPAAWAAGGACDPAQSTFTTNHASVPADNAWDATLTATCLDAAGSPIAGRTIVVQAASGSSIVAPASVVTDAGGVATFSVKDATVEGPITYTAVDQDAGVSFAQTADVTFVYCDTTIVPIAAIGGFGLAILAGGGLVFAQIVRRRRRTKTPQEA